MYVFRGGGYGLRTWPGDWRRVLSSGCVRAAPLSAPSTELYGRLPCLPEFLKLSRAEWREQTLKVGSAAAARDRSANSDSERRQLLSARLCSQHEAGVCRLLCR